MIYLIIFFHVFKIHCVLYTYMTSQLGQKLKCISSDKFLLKTQIMVT